MELLEKNVNTLAGVINKIGGAGTLNEERLTELVYALKNSLQETIVETANTSADIEVGISAGAKNTPSFINDGGTITCSAFECFLYDNTAYSGNPKLYPVSEATFVLEDGGSQYVYVDYNNGSPIYLITNDIVDICGSCQVLIFKVWRVGTEVHSFDTDAHGSGLPNKIERSLYDTVLYQRSLGGGLIISEKTTPNNRTVVVSSGRVYIGATPVEVLDFNSSTNVMYEMVNTAGVWSQTTKLVYDNTNINVGDGGVTAMADTYWGVRWFYRSIGDDRNVFCVLGNAEHATKAEAELESERTDLSALVKGHCLLVGRAVIQKGADSGTMSSAFTVTFTGSSVVNHDDTGNIKGGAVGEYNHLSDDELALALQSHAQNTDTYLDLGGTNQVAASDVKAAVTSSHTHSNKATLDNITAAFTTGLKSSYDGAVSSKHTQNTDSHLDFGGESQVAAVDIAGHLASFADPHNVTKEQVGLGDVPNLDTTAAVNHVDETGNAHSLDHNDNNKLQGGTTAEYYHLTATQHTDKIVNMKFGDVAGGNYSQFESDGTLKFIGNATYWKDLNFPIRTSGGGAPSLVAFVGNLTMPVFAVNDYVVFDTQELPHEWKVGSSLYFHIHLVTNGTNTTNRFTKWEFEYMACDLNSAFGSASTVITTSDLTIPANTPARTHILFPIAIVTLPSNNIGGHLIVRLKRVAATGTAPSSQPWIAAFQCHIECDTMGSRELATK